MVIDFHFDFLSPYAYLAWTQVHALARPHGATVRPIPTLLGALLTHNQTRGPAEVPAKRTYAYADTLRSARRLHVPFGPPPSHPFNPLLPLRACCIIDGGDQQRLITALFAQTWGGEGIGCDTAEKLAQAEVTAGLAGADLVQRAQSVEAKNALRLNTDVAIARGVFGVPTMVTGPGPTGLFWGLDSFPALERQLAGEDSIKDSDFEVWASLPKGVSR